MRLWVIGGSSADTLNRSHEATVPPKLWPSGGFLSKSGICPKSRRHLSKWRFFPSPGFVQSAAVI